MIQKESLNLNKAKTISTIFHSPIPPPILFVYLFMFFFWHDGAEDVRHNKTTQTRVWLPYATEKSSVIETEKTDTSEDLVYEVSGKIIGWLALLLIPSDTVYKTSLFFLISALHEYFVSSIKIGM